jgi:hypothetical protein
LFAGQDRLIPSFLALRVFELLYGANLSEAGNDSLAGVQRAQHCDPGAEGRLCDSPGSPIVGV